MKKYLIASLVSLSFIGKISAAPPPNPPDTTISTIATDLNGIPYIVHTTTHIIYLTSAQINQNETVAQNGLNQLANQQKNINNNLILAQSDLAALQAATVPVNPPPPTNP